MILTQFDFLRRAVEALAVGASLALQAANLASTNCMLEACSIANKPAGMESWCILRRSQN